MVSVVPECHRASLQPTVFAPDPFARGNRHVVMVLVTKDSVLDNWDFLSLQFGQS